MAKLSQLLTLEKMLEAYDNLNYYDVQLVKHQGECIQLLVDGIIAKIKRLLESKTRLSCRNVLVANFRKMSKTAYWLKFKLFQDLPIAISRVLVGKIELMVDLLKALMVKIIDVEAEFADEFFERMKKRCRKFSTTDYDLWKARQSRITKKGLVRYQVDLTAEMLSSGILKYAEVPNGEEIQNVDKNKLALTLTDKDKITDAFIGECAKLRRYSHWEGCRFVIDYQLLRKYMFCFFGKLTSDQHVKMFEYDIQLKQIYEDVKKLKLEEKDDTLKEEKKKPDEELFHFIYPSISGEEEWQIHEEVKRLVMHHGIQEICQYLYQMSQQKKILLPKMSSVAYPELVRMGMPTTAGYSEKNFNKYYRH